MSRTTSPKSSPPKNIVVFGQSGAGKSSLINIIAGGSTAATSSRAIGRTFEYRKCDVEVHGKCYAIWDTAGLDEGSHGRAPAERAEENLKQLLHELVKVNGIDLLIHCVSGSRPRKALLNNYNLFYSAIGRKKVPIALVVTGLENEEGEMEEWWAANEAEFTALKMHFDAHACVTTLDAQRVTSTALKQRCLKSRQTILSMIATTCSRDHWETRQRGWSDAALADVKATVSPGRHSNPPQHPSVVIYEPSERPPTQIWPTKNKSPFEGRLMKIGGSPRGADLLIFCVSIGADLKESLRKLVPFYKSYGGETRPVVVVVKEAETDEATREWWNKCNDGPKKMQAFVNALPPLTSSRANNAVAKLQNLIQTRALHPVTAAKLSYVRWLLGRKTSPNLKPGGPNSALDDDTLTASKVWTR